MYCPLKVDKVGYFGDCQTSDCAWWDASLNQCCIKTMAIAPILVNETPKTSTYQGSWADETRARYEI